MLTHVNSSRSTVACTSDVRSPVSVSVSIVCCLETICYSSRSSIAWPCCKGRGSAHAHTISGRGLITAYWLGFQVTCGVSISASTLGSLCLVLYYLNLFNINRTLVLCLTELSVIEWLVQNANLGAQEEEQAQAVPGRGWAVGSQPSVFRLTRGTAPGGSQADEYHGSITRRYVTSSPQHQSYPPQHQAWQHHRRSGPVHQRALWETRTVLRTSPERALTLERWLALVQVLWIQQWALQFH